MCCVLNAGSLVFGFGAFDFGTTRHARWETLPFNFGGVERSLSGGLRFSLQGQSYNAYKNLFTWQGSAPSDAVFQQLILDSFAAWTVPGPLGTTLSFTEDLGTVPTLSNNGTGAEIDLFAAALSFTGIGGQANFSVSTNQNMNLTNGQMLVGNGVLITGSQIRMNTNEATWTPGLFQRVLTHEIGHTLGLADVELAADATSHPGNMSLFLDNQSPVVTTAHLVDSSAHLINTSIPEDSIGATIFGSTFDPSLFDSDDVNTGAPFLLMETDGDPGFPDPAALGNDDFAGRQFLYPVAIPEPSAFLFLGVVTAVGGSFKLWNRARRLPVPLLLDSFA
jgi:hypothetical protein